MTKNRRIFPSAAPEPASPLTEAPRHKRKNWRSWLTIQVESERYQPPRSGNYLPAKPGEQTITAAIAKRLGQLMALDLGTGGQIGDGAGHPQQPMVGAGGG